MVRMFASRVLCSSGPYRGPALGQGTRRAFPPRHGIVNTGQNVDDRLASSHRSGAVAQRSSRVRPHGSSFVASRSSGARTVSAREARRGGRWAAAGKGTRGALSLPSPLGWGRFSRARSPPIVRRSRADGNDRVALLIASAYGPRDLRCGGFPVARGVPLGLGRSVSGTRRRRAPRVTGDWARRRRGIDRLGRRVSPTAFVEGPAPDPRTTRWGPGDRARDEPPARMAG